MTNAPACSVFCCVVSFHYYVLSNVRLVLYAVNAFKGTGTDEDMLEIAKALVR